MIYVDRFGRIYDSARQTYIPDVDPAYRGLISAGQTSFPEPPDCPLEVTRRQALIALANSGMLDATLALFDSLPRSDVRRIDFETSQKFVRLSSTTQAMAAQLGISEIQLNQLFIAAAQVPL